MMNKLFLALSIIMVSSCAQSQQKEYGNATVENEIEANHWADGKAEIAVYDLIQNRYNGLHEGKVVSIFVPEDFLTKKQVKNERYQNPNTTKILKNIRNRKFTTGIYDYTILSSVFTPLDRKKYKRSLKVSMSMQEWCGTTYMQLNRRNDAYQMEIRSYFEAEGDRVEKLADAVIEDELFNLIRMNPEFLPTGEFQLIPGLAYTALKHKETTTYLAEGKIEQNSDDRFEEENLMAYRLTVEAQNRELVIVFEGESPYLIKGWKEEYPSAFDGKKRESIARLNSVSRKAYWGLNGVEDTKYRKELGL